MSGYNELKIQVGFELDENVGSKLEKELAALSRAKDFKIDATIELEKNKVELLEKLEKTLDKFNSTTNADVNKISQIAKAFSSITIDDAVVKNIDKIQKSLESFSKLSVDLQKRLANVSLFEGAESELKGVTMNMKQFDEQVEKTLANIKKGVKGSSESLTGYVNAQKGTVEVLVERLNDVYKVTKNIDASGNVIGKVTGNVDGYVKSITSSMKSNYDKLLRYQSQYYKAVSEQDSDMVKALDSVMDYYKYQQKLLEQALDNNGLSEYADNTVKELKQVYEMTKRIEDIKSLNLLEQKEVKEDKKILNDFIKDYDNVIKQLKKYEPELLGADSKKNKEEREFLENKVAKLRDTKEQLESMIPSFKDWEKALAEFEKKDNELQDRIKQKQAKLKDKEVEESNKKAVKDENDLYKDTINKYKSLTKEIESLSKKQLDAFYKGDTTTFNKLESDIKGLYDKRDALDETIKKLKDYGKAQKEIDEINKSTSNEIDRKIANIQDNINKKAQEEIAKLQKNQEKSDKEDLNKYLDGYKKTSKELANATNEFYKAIENGSQNTIDLYDKETEALAKKQKEYLDLLKANKYYNQVEDEIREIDSESAKQIAKQEAIIKDLREKNAIKDREDTIKMYSKLFDQLELSRVEDRNSEPIRQRQELEKYVKDYEVLVDKIIALKNKQATADKNENKETSSRYGLEILELEESKRSLLELIKTHKDYAEVKDKMIAIQKDIANKNRLLEATINDDRNKKETSNNDKREKEKYSYLLDEYEKTVNKINSLAKEQRRALDSGNQPLFNQVTEDIKALKLREDALKKDIATLKDYEKANEKIAKITKENREELNRVDAKREGESENRRRIEVEKLSDAYEKLGKAIQENLSKANNLKDSSLLKDTNIEQVYNDLLKMSKIDFSNLGKADVDNLNDKLEKLVKTLKEYESLKIDNKRFELNDLKVDKLEGEFKSLESQIRETLGNSYADTLIADLKELRQVASKSGDEFEIMSKKWSNSMDDVKREMKSLKGDMGSSGGFFSDFYEELFTFTAGELLADGIRSVGNAMKDIVMEYDHAMTNLKKVANPEDIMSASQLDAIEQKAVSIAKNVGMASQDVISAIADTIQMSGRSMEESIVIAEQTMMLANVAEMTQESASQAVVSMMAAFNLDPLKEVPIVVDGVTKSTTELTNAMDMVNYVGNNFSISSEGIVSALQKGGAVLAQYGVSMTDTIALVTGANKVLQDPEVVK